MINASEEKQSYSCFYNSNMCVLILFIILMVILRLYSGCGTTYKQQTVLLSRTFYKAAEAETSVQL